MNKTTQHKHYLDFCSLIGFPHWTQHVCELGFGFTSLLSSNLIWIVMGRKQAKTAAEQLNCGNWIESMWSNLWVLICFDGLCSLQSCQSFQRWSPGFWWWKLYQQRAADNGWINSAAEDPLGITVRNCPLVLEQGDSNWPEKTKTLTSEGCLDLLKSFRIELLGTLGSHMDRSNALLLRHQLKPRFRATKATLANPEHWARSSVHFLWVPGLNHVESIFCLSLKRTMSSLCVPFVHSPM